MKRYRFLIACLTFTVLPFYLLYAEQESNIDLMFSFTENTSDLQKFQMYTDTISDYMYRDNKIVKECIERCDVIIDKNISIPSNIRFRYGIEKIYYASNYVDPLTAYQIVKEHEAFLESDEISMELKGSFLYIRGFTYMALGDLDAAQKTFQRLIENGKLQNDIPSMINGLYSTGQLLSDEKEYESAINYLLEVLELAKADNVRSSTAALVYLELTEAYTASKQFDEALNMIDIALEYLEKHKITQLKSEFLLFKGEIKFTRKDFITANEILTKVEKDLERTQDPLIQKSYNFYKINLLTAQGKYESALSFCQELMDDHQDENADFQTLVELLDHAHELCNKMGRTQKAYDYLFSYNQIKDQLAEEKKKQQTAYLKIKFESEQKEKDNELLSAEVVEKQNQNKLLFWLIGIFGIGLLVLLSAFYQKKKYNRRLEVEVHKRTKELQLSNRRLEISNKELDEFNRILSHDLKEPIRSIVSFSNLVKREVGEHGKLKEYIGFIENSGQQLYQLINDVASYKNISSINEKEKEKINVNLLVDRIVGQTLNTFLGINVVITYQELPYLFINKRIVTLVFKILIDNGIRYNDKQNRVVEIKYLTKDDRHFFEFKDNGIGIPQDYFEKVFGMFKRLNDRQKYIGSGLGLSTAQKLLKKVNGIIHILHSEVGKGTTFQMSFPAIEVQKDKPVLAEALSYDS